MLRSTEMISLHGHLNPYKPQAMMSGFVVLTAAVSLPVVYEGHILAAREGGRGGFAKGAGVGDGGEAVCSFGLIDHPNGPSCLFLMGQKPWSARQLLNRCSGTHRPLLREQGGLGRACCGVKSQ